MSPDFHKRGFFKTKAQVGCLEVSVYLHIPSTYGALKRSKGYNRQYFLLVKDLWFGGFCLMCLVFVAHFVLRHTSTSGENLCLFKGLLIS